MRKYHNSYWPGYVPVSRRKAAAERQLKKLKKSGIDVQPIRIEGRTIARSFWGKAWCNHLESFSDYDNRLPRGRSYVRNSAICHLDIQPRKVSAQVYGSRLYAVEVKIKPLDTGSWDAVKVKCGGQIGSILELLQGNLSNEVMRIVTDRRKGLFPMPDEISFTCSCPDWASMCKHVAAVMYGIGRRLDAQPELLFILRDVDPKELIAGNLQIEVPAAAEGIDENDLENIFGVEIDGTAGSETVAEQHINVSETEPGSADGLPTSPLFHVRDENGLVVFTSKAVSELRSQLGLTVVQFAKRLNVTPPTVYRWESSIGIIRLRLHSQIELESLIRFGLE